MPEVPRNMSSGAGEGDQGATKFFWVSAHDLPIRSAHPSTNSG